MDYVKDIEIKKLACITISDYFLIKLILKLFNNKKTYLI